jgi:hypothetical protein
VKKLRDNVDVLFSPASFLDEDRSNMEVLFPSKLAHYTAAGLPILVMGPPYASSVLWAREYPGVAEVIKSDDLESIVGSLRKLQRYSYRNDLARQAIRIGIDLFSYEKGIAKFYEAIRAAESYNRVTT